MKYFKKSPSRTLGLVLLCMLSQCKSDDAETKFDICDCESSTVNKPEKDIEAVVVYIQGNNPEGNQGPDTYVLSTDPADFARTSHVAGPNILVPCGSSLSVPLEFQKAGLRAIVSYKRKRCYGAITQPTLRSSYGYFIELTSIKRKP